MRISRHAVVYTAGVLALSGLALQFLGFVYRIVLSRMLGAEGMGVYQLVFPVISVVLAASGSGLYMAVSRLSAQYMALDRKGGLRPLLSTAIRMFLVVCLAASTVTVLFSKTISLRLLGDGRVQTALIILPAYLLLTGLENIHKSFFHGVRHMKPVVISEICELVLRMAAVTALLAVFSTGEPGVSAALIVTGMVISEVFSVTFLSLTFKRSLKGRGKEEKTFFCRKIAGIALPVSAAGLVNNLLSSANAVLIPQRLMVSGMSRQTAMQTFGLLTGMLVPLFWLPFSLIGSLSSVIIPKLSEGLALRDKADIRRKTAKALHATGLLAMPVVAVLIPLARPIFSLLYGQQMPGGVILPLALGSLLAYYEAACGGILYGIGLQKRAAALSVLGELIQLGFTCFAAALPGVGIHGYLAGYAVSAAVLVAAQLHNVVRHTGVTLRLRNWLLTPALSAVLSGLVASWSYRGLAGANLHPAAALAIAIAASASVYLMLLSLFGLKPVRYLRTLVPTESAKS